MKKFVVRASLIALCMAVLLELGSFLTAGRDISGNLRYVPAQNIIRGSIENGFLPETTHWISNAQPNGPTEQELTRIFGNKTFLRSDPGKLDTNGVPLRYSNFIAYYSNDGKYVKWGTAAGNSALETDLFHGFWWLRSFTEFGALGGSIIYRKAYLVCTQIKPNIIHFEISLHPICFDVFQSDIYLHLRRHELPEVRILDGDFFGLLDRRVPPFALSEKKPAWENLEHPAQEE